MARVFGWSKTIAINVVIALVFVSALNIASGLVLASLSNPFVPADGATDHRIDLPAFADKDRAREVFRDFYQVRNRYHPYNAVVPAPLSSGTTNVDEVGIRATPGGPEDPIGIIRLFGGSTMWGTGVADEDTIPGRVQARMASYQVVNHAQSGFVSRQGLATLVTLISQRQQLGTVVFYDGANDVFHLCQNRNSLYGHGFEGFLQEAMEAKLAARQAEPRWVWRAVAGNIEVLARRLFGEVGGQTTRIADIPPTRCDQNPEVLPEIADLLWRNWQTARQLVEQNGGQFLAVLQPISYVGAPVIDYLSLGDEWGEWYQEVYGLIRQRIAEEQATWVLDMTDAFDVPEPLYIDFAHVNARGNDIIAERLVAALSR